MTKNSVKMTPLELYESLTRDELTALAERAGISRVYLYQLLTGRRTPSLEYAQRITDACGGRVEFIRRASAAG